jgi:hypothetical protein
MVCGTEGVRNVWYASDCKHRSRCKHGGVKLQGGVGNLIRRKRREGGREGGWEACVLVAEVVGSVPQALERHQRWYRSRGYMYEKRAGRGRFASCEPCDRKKKKMGWGHRIHSAPRRRKGGRGARDAPAGWRETYLLTFALAGHAQTLCVLATTKTTEWRKLRKTRVRK